MQTNFRNEDLLPNFDFYVLDSNQVSVDEIEKKLGNPTKVFKCNVMRRRDKDGILKETKSKTLIGCSKVVIEKFKENYPEYSRLLNEYNWESFHSPNLNAGETFNLHVTGIPIDFTHNEGMDYIVNRLSSILSPEHFHVEFPFKSRQKATIVGYAKVIFEPYVPEITRKYAKVLLNHEEVKRIPSSYFFSSLMFPSLFNLEEGKKLVEDNVKELVEETGLDGSKYNLSFLGGAGNLFELNFHVSVGENVRRAIYNKMQEKKLYEFTFPVNSCTDNYITAIWFDVKKANSAANKGSKDKVTSFSHVFLGNFHPIKFPSRMERNTKLNNA